jgi:hypothetical protein
MDQRDQDLSIGSDFSALLYHRSHLAPIIAQDQDEQITLNRR